MTRTTVRAPMERFALIVREISRKPTNARQIAELVEMSSKSIHRDIEFLRDRLNLPIEYDPLLHGFVLTAPVCLCAVCSGHTGSTQGQVINPTKPINVYEN